LFAGLSLKALRFRPERATNQEIYGHMPTNHEILAETFQTPSVAAGFQKALNHMSAKRS